MVRPFAIGCGKANTRTEDEKNKIKRNIHVFVRYVCFIGSRTTRDMNLLKSLEFFPLVVVVHGMAIVVAGTQ